MEVQEEMQSCQSGNIVVKIKEDDSLSKDGSRGRDVMKCLLK